MERRRMSKQKPGQGNGRKKTTHGGHQSAKSKALAQKPPATAKTTSRTTSTTVPDICQKQGTGSIWLQMKRFSQKSQSQISTLRARLAQVNQPGDRTGWIEASSASEEAERLEAQLALMERQLNYSTLKLSFLELGWDGKSCLAKGCHNQISAARLTAKPEALVCVHCRKKAEALHTHHRRIELQYGYILSLAA